MSSSTNRLQIFSEGTVEAREASEARVSIEIWGQDFGGDFPQHFPMFRRQEEEAELSVERGRNNSALASLSSASCQRDCGSVDNGRISISEA